MSKLIYDMKMELITMTNHFLKAKLLFNKKKRTSRVSQSVAINTK